MKLKEIALLLKCRFTGKEESEISGVGSLEDASQGEITFLEKTQYLPQLHKSHATAVILPEEMEGVIQDDFSEGGPTLLWVKNPRLAFLSCMEIFKKEESDFGEGIHPTVILGKETRIEPTVSISPFSVVGNGVEIGSRSRIGSFVHIGPRVKIGSDCLLYPHVSVREGVEIGDRCILHPGAVLGSDGFGFIHDGGIHRKIPQMGSVLLEDDVEVGANVTIDRGTLGTTRIGRGTKIDNLVQIAHNVEIGEGSLLAAQVGIAGSTKIGKRVVFGGQAGLADHLTIGDEVQIGAQAGVTKSFPAKTVVSGYPARPHAQAMRIYAAMQRLPELLKKIGKGVKTFV